MKKLLPLFFLIFSITYLQSQVKKGFEIPKNPKIGLSLSGGGAKGFAHVGVLKVIDSLGIKIDYISGTSMGALVGGLYASGYTAKDIEKIIQDTDFYNIIVSQTPRKESSFFEKTTDKYLLTVPIKNGKVNVLPKAISKGQQEFNLLKEILKNVTNIEDFSKLPIPYFCVATNLESGNMKILDHGDLVSSMMASSAYPGLIDPVKIGDSLYIDGAMTVNFPSKPLKDKGMDIIIGVDLSQKLDTRKDLNSVVDILNQVIDFQETKSTEYQYKYTDLLIHPDLSGLSATSYTDKAKILDSGYNAALKYVSFLEKLPKRENVLLRAPSNPIYSDVYKIDSLVIDSSKIFNRSYVLGKMGLKIPSMQTYGSINNMIDKLYATNNYDLINYDLLQRNGKNYLKLTVTENDTRIFLKFGLHYDNIFKTGLLINATIKRLLFRNSIFSVDGVIGDKPRYYFNYLIDNGYIPGFGIYSSGMSFDLKNKYNQLTEKWTWYRNEAFIQSTWMERYAIGGGIRHDYYASSKMSDNTKTSQNFISPYLFVKSDTQDNKEFPTRGFYLAAEGKILDAFASSSTEKPVQAKITANLNFPITSRFTYRLNLFGGFTAGKVLNTFFQYRIGGIFEQDLENYTRLPGIFFGQIASDNLLTAQNYIQYRLWENYFLIGNLNFANSFNSINIDNLVQVKQTTIGLTAGYKSPFGQIKVNYSIATNGGQGILSIILGHWF